jgi:predicted DNA-binding protein YlxM (UPF0122 family)
MDHCPKILRQLRASAVRNNINRCPKILRHFFWKLRASAVRNNINHCPKILRHFFWKLGASAVRNNINHCPKILRHFFWKLRASTYLCTFRHSNDSVCSMSFHDTPHSSTGTGITGILQPLLSRRLSKLHLRKRQGLSSLLTVV